MSVLIKGMKLPENCKECPFCLWSNHYQMYVCFVGNRYAELFFDGKYPMTESTLRSKRADNCPMTGLHPHGRLIDADLLVKVLKRCSEDDWNKKAIPFSWSYAYECEINVVDVMPTIIEAEPPKEET